MMPTGPVKILTVEDCELRIKNALEELENIDLLEIDQLYLEANISIWEYVGSLIVQGNMVTFDSSETFGYWPKQEISV